MTVRVELMRVFEVRSVNDSDVLDAETDRIMDALVALEGPDLTDSAVSVDLEKRIVEIEVAANGNDFDEAVAAADSAIRAAIHTAGGNTPRWDTITLRQTAEAVPTG